MSEDFVSFDLAKKLKEKGYNKPFYFYYRTDDELIHHVNTCDPLVYSDKIDDEVVIAPTISQVLKWLRDSHAIHIHICLYSKGWYCDVYTFEYYEEDKEYSVKHNVQFDEFSTYEEAALAGIEYALDNLI